ncbi:MAG: uracil-DNA glycosylase [Paracoccaceae bacterium]
MDESWRRALAPELAAPRMQDLTRFLAARSAAGATILPPEGDRFSAFALTPLPAVKVVILGQDPYHGPGQAHGLAFSVRPGVAVPPSLRNIFKEIQADLGLPIPRHGHLDHWARQGVLMLNDVLTVEAGQPGAHQARGWEDLTDAAVRAVNAGPNPVAFLLWGKPAQKKAGLIQARHLVLTAPHPSPLAAHRGFFGCRHFSQANEWLAEQARAPIDWSLPEGQG